MGSTWLYGSGKAKSHEGGDPIWPTDCPGSSVQTMATSIKVRKSHGGTDGP